MTLIIMLYVLPAFVGLSMAAKCLHHEEYRTNYKPDFDGFDLGFMIFCSIMPVLNIAWLLQHLFQDKN